MVQFPDIEPGSMAERTVTIEQRHTVTHTGAAVLSTPMMISLMESVANDLVQPRLPAEHVTVGFEVHVRHRAPALLGTKVTAWARLLEVDGCKLLFEVRAQQGDKVIGEGLHRRTIIERAG